MSGEISDRKPSEFDAAITAAIVRQRITSASNDLQPEAEDPPLETPPTDDGVLKSGYRLCERYELVEHVHSGGMSHVYKAVDLRRRWGNDAPSHVAIKMMRQTLGERADLDRILEREATKAMQLAHPNVVSILDYDQHDGQFFLVMEWLAGESLNHLLRRTQGQPLAAEFVERVIEGIVAGVQHAHNHGIVHADMNPANVFITDTQEVKVLDFGVARYIDEDTQDDAPLWATHSYASPQVLSGIAPTVADDVFSVACLVYRLRGGRLPFSGMSSLAAFEAREPIRLLPNVPRAVAAPIFRGLAYERELRPQDVAVFSKHEAVARLKHWVETRELPSNRRWLWTLPVAALAAVALVWFVVGDAPERPETAADVDAYRSDALPAEDETLDDPVVDRAVPVQTAAEPSAEDNEVAQLLQVADTAFAAERFIAPIGDNARDGYREVLVRRPNEVTARNGLRAISDTYAERATSALRANDIETALAALTVAVETDVGNPSNAVVTELYEAKSEKLLADTRLAIASGATERAAELVAETERYPSIDAAIIAELRAALRRNALQQRLRNQLAVLDGHLAAGRLLLPQNGNALSALQGLIDEHGDEPQLRQYAERLGERLLARAAFATAEGSLQQAGAALDAVDGLGVLEADAAAARVSLDLARQERNAELGDAVSQRLTADAAEGSALPGTVVPSGIKVTAGPDKSDYQTLADLAIQRFVAPEYPRRAGSRRSGFVELAFEVNPDGSTGAIEVVSAEPGNVFVRNARRAVRRWRFAERAEPARARVRLTFAP